MYMIIEAKPMLEREIRAHKSYIQILENERETLYVDPLDPDDKILEVNAEIELSKDMIRVIEDELKNKH